MVIDIKMIFSDTYIPTIQIQVYDISININYEYDTNTSLLKF